MNDVTVKALTDAIYDRLDDSGLLREHSNERIYAVARLAAQTIERADTAPTERPDWDTYFLNIAQVVASRADCSRTRFGAVVVDRDGRVASVGYNGSPPGEASCLAGECPRAHSGVAHGHADYSDCIALHAEMNAIANADRFRCKDGTIYVWGGYPPCDMCSKLIRAAGIGRVVWS